jgi:hypothetical protein
MGIEIEPPIAALFVWPNGLLHARVTDWPVAAFITMFPPLDVMDLLLLPQPWSPELNVSGVSVGGLPPS